TVALATGLPLASRAVTVTVDPVPPAVMGEVAPTVVCASDTAPAVTLNALLVAPTSTPERAVSVYPVPALSRLRAECVETPDTRGAMVSPDKVAPPALVPMRTVSLPAAAETLLLASRAVTVTAGAIAAP